MGAKRTSEAQAFHVRFQPIAAPNKLWGEMVVFPVRATNRAIPPVPCRDPGQEQGTIGPWLPSPGALRPPPRHQNGNGMPH